MRRLVLILLICLFPLQSSWAAVAHYWEHGSLYQVMGKAAHAAEAGERAAAKDTHGHQRTFPTHDHCHLAGFVAVPSGFTPIAVVSSRMSPPETDSRYRSQTVRPPERPQWVVSA
ncbi:hypothetical protein [Candidatus Macondimonas diazotrophica]|jgi:hypothetical protein|uniref:DUF2946 domain-containing protein n=1 Tax=Candidatus Macondimonas diazotrophica TaxID=2305248 RepID=A0A4Z0FAE8_9GAMM|nr:hypothetical protein [Candidatus Macondimonas diazotrophica]NCU01623.1 hypothetical protein [Candidatus Macondimonas diazotrophica]TFZ82419.1 hypothetical protein E4680_08015 [Candidatus Macondimonas diazotrophica]HBG29172.1 hypothetical protein [Gammaproteobacteria bacterium]